MLRFAETCCLLPQDGILSSICNGSCSVKLSDSCVRNLQKVKGAKITVTLCRLVNKHQCYVSQKPAASIFRTEFILNTVPLKHRCLPGYKRHVPGLNDLHGQYHQTT